MTRGSKLWECFVLNLLKINRTISKVKFWFENKKLLNFRPALVLGEIFFAITILILFYAFAQMLKMEFLFHVVFSFIHVSYKS